MICDSTECDINMQQMVEDQQEGERSSHLTTAGSCRVGRDIDLQEGGAALGRWMEGQEEEMDLISWRTILTSLISFTERKKRLGSDRPFLNESSRSMSDIRVVVSLTSRYSLGPKLEVLKRKDSLGLKGPSTFPRICRSQCKLINQIYT
ncbi:hypothetical protein BgiMline_028151 [Biomphalaria glabrata]